MFSSRRSQFVLHILLQSFLRCPAGMPTPDTFSHTHGVGILEVHRGSTPLHHQRALSTSFFQPVINCHLLPSKHFNFIVRLLLSLNSFLQFCAVFASCTTTEHAPFIKLTNCILNNPLLIVWWQLWQESVGQTNEVLMGLIQTHVMRCTLTEKHIDWT